jgi:hypothetical protein
VTGIPQVVRELALHSFWKVPAAPGFRAVEAQEFSVMLHSLPIAQVAEPRQLGPDDVAAVIENVRDLVREHGRGEVAWMVGPEHRWIGERFERLGLVNRDSAGLEAIENAMALYRPIVERLEFQFIDEITVYVDDLSA